MPVRPVVAFFRALVAVIGTTVARRIRAQVVAVGVLASRSGTAIGVQILVRSEKSLVALTAIALAPSVSLSRDESFLIPCRSNRMSRAIHTFADQHC